MRLSHDIWHQVIQYLEHDGGDSDATEKRTTLLSLALTSRLLSSLALAALWRNMTSMGPIVDVINSFTPHQEDPFLTWVYDEDDCSYWEFWVKPDEDKVYQRVREYFSRIRVFQALGKRVSERMLWPILTAWFWKGESLLPNLQELIVYFDKEPNPYHHLTLMVPPRLKRIATMDVRFYLHVVEFYQHLRSQGCSPEEVEYVGDLRCPLILTSFDNLNKLVVKGPYRRDRHNTPFVLAELLQDIPFLRWLEIDLGTLHMGPNGNLQPFEHPSLKNVTLEGTTLELSPFLSSETTCPLVKNLSLKIRFTEKLTWKFLFERAVVIFPNINDFSIQVLTYNEGLSQLDLSDLDTLIPQPMEAFTLEDVPNKLAQQDLQSVLDGWPKLRTFTLTGGETPFDAEALLSTPTYRNLHTLHLPFDFIPLASPLIFPPATPKNSALRHLYIAASTRFPSTLKEKAILAYNLCILLPELKSVEDKDRFLGTEATDLREIIKGMQAVVCNSRCLT